MHSIESTNEHRCEQRFHPDSEHVSWRKVGATGFETGYLVDVSQTGLSFRILPSQVLALEPGDEIAVSYVGHDTHPTNYAVVWEHSMEAALSFGCTRVTPAMTVVRPRHAAYRLVLARLQRRVQNRQKIWIDDTDAVVLGSKTSEIP
jgi:PilZ domain